MKTRSNFTFGTSDSDTAVHGLCYVAEILPEIGMQFKRLNPSFQAESSTFTGSVIARSSGYADTPMNAVYRLGRGHMIWLRHCLGTPF